MRGKHKRDGPPEASVRPQIERRCCRSGGLRIRVVCLVQLLAGSKAAAVAVAVTAVAAITTAVARAAALSATGPPDAFHSARWSSCTECWAHRGVGKRLLKLVGGRGGNLHGTWEIFTETAVDSAGKAPLLILCCLESSCNSDGDD